MPELIPVFTKGKKLAAKSDKVIERYLRSMLRNYKNTLTYALEVALGRVEGGKFITPASYKRNENAVRLSLRKTMQDWWDDQIPFAESVGKGAYTVVREFSFVEFKKLFNIKINTIPLEDIPNIADPETGGKLSVDTGNIISEDSGIPDLTLTLGKGGINAEYERLLRQQFDAGINPRNAIRTFSAREVAFIEHEMIKGLREGVDSTVIRKRLVKKLAGVGASKEAKRRIAINVRRILRTTHENASIASAFQFALANSAVSGLVRHTGPRPCIACISLDGRVYKHYQSFRDHPNGQCFVTYELLPPASLGIDVSSLPLQVRNAWRTNLGEIRPKRFDFMAASAAEQRIIFANDKLFELWKSEKLPLETMSTFKNGSWVPATYKDTLEKLPTLGGLTYPKITFPTEMVKARFNSVIDPLDRANERFTFSETIPDETEMNVYGALRYPKHITRDMTVEADDVVRNAVDRVLVGYISIGTMPYYAYNELARALKINIRKTIEGKIYYVRRN